MSPVRACSFELKNLTVDRRLPAALLTQTIVQRTGDRPAFREQAFTAFGGRLIGRPDVIRAREVIDYKSGAILEHDAATETDVVKAAYVRQLRIYGYLVKTESRLVAGARSPHSTWGRRG